MLLLKQYLILTFTALVHTDFAIAAIFTEPTTPTTTSDAKPIIGAAPVYNETLALLHVYTASMTYLKPYPAKNLPDFNCNPTESSDTNINTDLSVTTAATSYSCQKLKDEHILIPPLMVTHGGLFSSHELLAFVSHSEDDTCTLSIRGSNQLLDFLIDDFNAIVIEPFGSECSGCRVHKGFYDAWHELKSGLLQSYNDLKCHERKNGLRITGHSLGAAMAFFAAYELSYGTTVVSKIHSIYTFGQPRVGDIAFTKDFINRVTNVIVNVNNAVIPYFRVTQYKDPVPHLPPMLVVDIDPSLMYYHAGPEVFYHTSDWHNDKWKGNYNICNDGENTVSCSSKYNFAEDLLMHVCDHCSYLGHESCGSEGDVNDRPECIDPTGFWQKKAVGLKSKMLQLSMSSSRSDIKKTVTENDVEVYI